MQDVLEIAESAAIDTLVLLGELRDRSLKDLKHQLRRAAVSVSSNIAEGRGRGRCGFRKDEDRFKAIALGSLKEAMSQLRVLANVWSQPERIAEILDKYMRVEELLVVDGKPWHQCEECDREQKIRDYEDIDAL